MSNLDTSTLPTFEAIQTADANGKWLLIKPKGKLEMCQSLANIETWCIRHAAESGNMIVLYVRKQGDKPKELVIDPAEARMALEGLPK